MRNKSSGLGYVFAIGRIRVLEKYLIRREVFEETLDAGLEEALRLFVETGLYPQGLLQLRDSQALEVALSQELAKIKKLILDLLLDKEFSCFLDAPNLESLLDNQIHIQSELLSDYLKHLTDMHNIKTFLRLYFLKEPEERLREAISREGFIGKEVFLNCYSKELAVFLNRLEFVRKREKIIDYAFFLREPIQRISSNHSFKALERAIDDFLIQVIKPAKYFSFGPEPLIAYYLAKENEIKLIRMIILAKLNRVLADTVRERLSGAYA